MKQADAFRLRALAVAEALRELDRPIPSGEFYAHVMGSLSLSAYEAILEALERAGLISRKNHLLAWTGPRV